MSDATDPPDGKQEAEHPHDSLAPVRERMRQFLTAHDTEEGSERSDRGDGKPLSDLVVEEREGRL